MVAALTTDLGSPVCQQYEMPNLPNHLRAWRLYRDLSQEAVGKLARTDKSQISKLEKGERRLTMDWLNKLSVPLKASPQELLGPPPQDRDLRSFVNTQSTVEAESWLADKVQTEVAPVLGMPELPVPGSVARDLPVLGSAHCGDGLADFTLNGETADWIRRPPALKGVASAFAVAAVGNSMAPRFEDGEVVFVHPGRRYAKGRDVLIELLSNDPAEPSGAALIKRFVSESNDKVVVEQFEPRKKITIPRNRIKRISLILKSEELVRD